MGSKRITWSVAGPGDIRRASVPRDMGSGKLDHGKVMVVGGSHEFHGAPSLASNAAQNLLAAMRTGAGYAVAYVPKGIADVNRKLSASIIVRGLPGDDITARNLPVLKDAAAHFDSVVVGIGAGRSAGTLSALYELISYLGRAGKVAVVDADATYAVHWKGRHLSANTIITPNDKEFALLYGRNVRKSGTSSRVAAAVALSNSMGCVVLLKGHETIITDGRRAKLVRSRHAALAVMGTGDVLSGIIGGFTAMTKDPFASAVAGAYLHSLIGDRLYSKKGNHIIASDVVEYIPRIMRRFDR